MGSRRFHAKSRNGCGQCKRRRIKCDEQPPICSNCRKRQIKCEYEDMFGTPNPSSDFPVTERSKDGAKKGQQGRKLMFRVHPLSHMSNGSSSTTNNNTLVPRSSGGLKMPLSQNPDSSLLELELLHHYCTMTSSTFSRDARILPTWTQEIPLKADHFPILKHNLISLAALHLAYLNPAAARKYTYQAAVYQSRALKKARACGVDIGIEPGPEFKERARSTMTSDGFLALVFSSGLVVVQELAALHPCYFPHARDKNKTKLDELVDRVLLIRSVVGLWEVGTVKFDALAARFFGACNKALPPNPMNNEAQTVLDGLDILNETMTTDREEQIAYASAIQMLRMCFEVAMANPPDWTSSFLWPHIVPDAYMTLLKQRKPFAMVIIGYFCALVQYYPDGWWARAWPEEVFGTLFNTLSWEWHAALEWPSRQISLSA